MSHNLPQTSSSANYQVIFDNAVEAYKKKTGKDLPSDPLLRRLESCNSPDTVLVVLREQIPAFDQSGSRFTTWVRPTINVLYAFSSTIGGAVSLTYPPAGVIVTGIAGLLSAIQGDGASQDALLDIFERIENIFRRLETYTEIRQTKEMTDIIIKVMVEVLLILALVTKEIKQGKLKTFLKKVAGSSEIDDALRRLDKLTQEEHRMATAQALRATHVVVDDAEHIKGELRQVIVRADDQQWEILRNNLTTWLSPPDPFINYNTTSEARYGGTGLWFTESDEFNSWKESASLLWVYGKPGAGKSIITSAIIEDIKNISNAGPAYMAFFFFDFKDTGKQDARAFLSSVILQLSQKSQSFYDILFNFYSVHEKGSQQPSIGALTKCLEDMIEASGDIPIYLILDAVDECPNTRGIPSSRRQVLDLVEKLVKQGPPRLHLCITSRPEVDIRTSLERLTSTSNRICLHDQVGQKKDIVEFIRGVVYSDENMRRWRDEDKELVIKVLSERANGMFRWVYCQLEVLRQCFPSSVQGVLAELPKSLDETYERILQQIPDPNRAHTHRLLQCLVVAAYPVQVEELAEVLAIDFSAPGMTPMLDVNLRWEDKERAVLSACSSLITIVEDRHRHHRHQFSRRVQFSHFSVKEFLTSNRLAASTLCYHHIRLEPAHTMMAQVCLSVLLQFKNNMNKWTILSYPLSKYAARHFVDHMEFENDISTMSDGVDDLLDRDRPHFYAWVWLQIGDWDWRNWHNTKMDWDRMSVFHPSMGLGLPSPPPPAPPPPSKKNPHPQYPPRLPPLYYAAALGHLFLARHLILECPQDLDVRDDKGCAPLHIAVLAGMEGVSQLLIEHTVDLGIRDINDRTPLHMAAYMGLAKVTQMLLERSEGLEARLNARDKNGRTPLHLASQRGHADIAGLFLKFGADVDAQDKYCMTPLLLLSCQHIGGGYHFAETAQLLLEHGASVHVRNTNGQMSLHAASHNGYSEIVALLLKFGADVDVQDNYSMTPLLLVSQKYSYYGGVSYLTEVAQLLLEHGASVHVRSKDGQMPLHAASRRGYSEIVALLLQFGVDVDAQDNDSMTPLQLVSQSQGFLDLHDVSDLTKIVQLLLEHGASVHVRNKDGQMPLHAASHHSYSEIVALLLQFGADVDVQDNDSMTPLLLVSQSQSHSPYGGVSYSTEVARLLLEHGASVHVQNKNGQMPLHAASHHGCSEIVALLLQFGADVDVQDNDSMTPLLLVSQSKPQPRSPYGGVSYSTEVARLLLEHGASVHVQNKNGQMPLHAASHHGHSEIVALLLQFGADVDPKDKDCMTPLQFVSQSQALLDLGDVSDLTKIAQLLLEHGASVHVRNKDGQMPLHAASHHSYSEIVALLLQFGADVDVQDNDSMTPLLLASQSQSRSRSPYCGVSYSTEVVRLLLEHGASVHVRNKDGQMPLHAASHHGCSDIVALLLKFGADVDAQDNDPMTPLLLVSRSPVADDFEIIKIAQLLLEHGASVYVRNKNGHTPLHLASQHGRSEIVGHLLWYGADVNAQDNSNFTPLHFAVSSPLRYEFSESPLDRSPTLWSVIETIKPLLGYGANRQIQNDKGETPLQIALRRGKQEIIDVLLDLIIHEMIPDWRPGPGMKTITAAFDTTSSVDAPDT